MASTSALSVQKRFKYDVFLSFRGEDTRKTFVDHLFHALHQKGITTYKDDERIEKGQRISDQLMRSIEDSRFHIIVFSKNYASSSWCLDELIKIMECHKTMEQTAYPVFYDVEPTEVRNQSGLVGEAFERFTKKRKRMLEDVDKEKEVDVGRWRTALKEATCLAGMELKNTFNGHEAKFIQKIVEDVSLKLHFFNSSIDGKLVGIETRVKEVVSSLETSYDDVRMIGIKGMEGGGKTTLARAVFDHISICFEGKSFVENVREVSKGSFSGLKKLQKQVLKDVSNEERINVASVSDGKKMMKKMMVSRKVLVVLDDVDDIEQLEALAGERNWFKPGSRIIITTRDEQVLAAHRVNFIHDVSLLSHEEAICLFSRYAFESEIPIEGCEELSRQIVHYAAGLPLTIKVMGSHLCGRSEREWVDAIERLKTFPLEKTLKRLELSYNGLHDDEKEIFLDVVCILKGEMKDRAIKILESCGFNAEIGLRVLEQKSLITISDTDGLRFHDHIEEMGWNIVRHLHPDEPSRHNRLWVKEEIETILLNEMGTEVTRSIKLNDTDLHTSTIMRGLRNMRELRFLSVHKGHREWIVDEVNQYLPDALRCLYWQYYPFQSLPQTFQANKLVNLEMGGSSISELWEGGEIKVLDKIRFLDLTCSALKTFDLKMTPNLEHLVFEGCFDFFELHMHAECPKLKYINLAGSKINNLSLGITPNLEHLNLEGCNEFVELHLPNKCQNLKSINLSGSKVSNLNLGMTPHLEKLNLEGCKEFVELHLPVECLSLKFLYLCGSKVDNLNLGMTPHLEKLNLRGCNDFVDLYLPVKCPNLKSLDLSGSKICNINLEMIPQLEMLNLEGCKEFIELHTLVQCPKLKFLNLTCTKVSNLNLGMTPNLEELYLKRCNEFVELHLPVECPKLKFLYLCGSKVSNLRLAMTPHLEKLDLQGCNEFVELQVPVECPNLKSVNLGGTKVSNLNLEMIPHLKKLNLKGCKDFLKLRTPIECPTLNILDLSDSRVSTLNLEMTPNLEELSLQGCSDFVELHMPIQFPKLKGLNLSGSKVCNLILGMTPYLEKLDLQGCSKFVELHVPVKCLNLESLDLGGSKVSDLNLEMIPHLEKLNLKGCNNFVELHTPVECPKLKFLDLSGSKVNNFNLEMTPHLELLSFQGCSNFVELHMPVQCPKLKDLNLSGSKVTNLNLGLTPHLEWLNLKGCYGLQEIYAPEGCLKNLVYLNLSDCLRFEYFLVDSENGLHGLDSLPKLRLKAKSLDICPLHPNSNLPKFQFKCRYAEPLPSLSGNLEKLLSFGLCVCTNLEVFSASICGLHNLKELGLEDGIPELVLKDLCQLESLERLALTFNDVKHLPDSICMLKHLRSLELEYCFFLEQFPNGLDRLKCLEKLHLLFCSFLQDIPNSICMLKHLKSLRLEHCFSIKQLPNDLGRLKCLKELNIRGVFGLHHLPRSISQLKGLRITGSRGQLESYGFTSLIKDPVDNTCYHIKL